MVRGGAWLSVLVVACLGLAGGLLASPASAEGDKAVLTGTVTDRGSGEPLPRVEVRVENREAGAFTWNYTDTDGTFRVEAPPGNLLVGFDANASIPPSCQDTPREMDSDLHACDAVIRHHDYAPVLRSILVGEGEHTLDVRLPRLGSNETGLRGWVVDERGRPVANATVMLHDVDPDRWAKTSTDEDGAWAFALDEGPVTLRVVADGFAWAASTEVAASPPRETVVELSAGSSLSELVGHGFAPPPPQDEGAWVDLSASTDAMGPPPASLPANDEPRQATPPAGVAALLGLLALACVLGRPRA